MRIVCALALCLTACASEGPERRTRPDPTTPGTGTTTTTGVTTTSTGTTTTTPIDCENIPDVPLNINVLPIETTEDFDFDADGNMVFAQWLGPALIGIDYQLQQSVISANVDDTRGISVLSDGRIIIAYIGSGKVGIIDPSTGSNTTLLSGLTGPNALEVGLDDVIYFTETGNGRVREFSLQTGQSTPIATGFSYPNGLVINETHDVLYVSDSTQGIYSIARNTDGTWEEPEPFFNPAGFGSYDGMEVDACGNLYILSFNSGKVVRTNPRVEPLEAVVVAELNDPNDFLWNAMHWGSDRGGWRRDTLYVTDRNVVFALELGVPGKDQPVDLAP